MLRLFSARWGHFALGLVLVTLVAVALRRNFHGDWPRPSFIDSLSKAGGVKSQGSALASTSASPSSSSSASSSPSSLPPAVSIPPRPIYKNATDRPLANRPFVAITETFPMAAAAKSSADLPPIPAWNKPPTKHVKEVTPLFIGFTRNWPLLQQTLVSFLTAGWPAGDIYVVENTGVMDANERGLLGMQNPFYLDRQRLTKVYGVNIITTPSLQTFAQLQNLFLYEAIKNKWPHYFWSHMDILVQSAEDKTPYKSFYLRCVDAIRQSNREQRRGRPPWALQFFAYDWVTLMNTAAMVKLGGWDTMISYYTTDCDMYDRMRMANMSLNATDAGPVYDSGESFEDLAILYRIGDQRGSDTWKWIQGSGKNMTRIKNKGGERNRWQIQQMGGQGEPYYRDMDGFHEALEYNVQAGISVFKAKWGDPGCSLVSKGLKLEDEWLVDRIAEDS